MKRALALASALLVSACGVTSKPATPAAPPAPVSTQASTAPTTAATEQSFATPAPDPRPADYKLAVKITKKQCFGSAGCNVDFHIEVTVSPTASASERFCQVTYEVSGIEDGPQINTFTITGDRYDRDEEDGSTATTRVKLTAKATDVECTG